MFCFAMTRRFHILFLLALALALYVGTAAAPALIDDADGGHAIAAREMLERRDFAVMHINGIRWLEKAPFHYWLVAASYALLGESTFATRLPLALGVVGLVLMVYFFGRHFWGERAGFYAGLAIGTGIGTWIYTRAMIPEAMYALQFTAAFYLFLRAWQGTLSPRAGYWGCAAVIGLAMLTRALIGVIFPLGVITLFVLATRGQSDGQPRWRELPVWSSALVFLLVAAPWHILVGLRAPGFFSFYFINEHFLRAIGARYPADYGSVPLLLWWAEHLVWLFPWSFFLPFALRELPKPRKWKSLDHAAQARLLTFLWAGLILLFFSVSKRMEYYSFGAWPALALLAGLALARMEEERDVWLPRVTAALAVLGVVTAAGFGTLVWLSRNVPAGGDIARLLEVRPVANTTAFDSFSFLTVQAFAALRGPALGAAAGFFFALVISWIVRRRGRALAANIVMALGMGMFIFAANAGFAAFEPHMSSRPLAEKLLPLLQPDDQLVIYGEFYGGPTLSFYTHRKTWLYNGRYNGLEFGSYYADAPKIFLTDQDFPAFWRGPRRVFLFAPQNLRREVLLRLPPDASYLVAEIGGRALYVNRPLTPDQPSLAQLAAVRN
ncbi:MAG: glycosyltransferase family 39 protein [Acidobacteria bacterium]|nr:glycosyltransferase family 39 protein [Acidobacteriota bacterium]MBI3661883.1 glycosyltransferase family 39 protein [Acidobacteriota bacterium]